MMENPPLVMRDLFQRLAHQLKTAIASDPATRGWTDASLDVRFSSSRSVTLKKIRVNVGGEALYLDALYGSLGDIIDDIGRVRMSEPCYGFIMSLNSQSKVEVRLNYDPKCFEDPDFWEK
jgi:hypothetical protein